MEARGVGFSELQSYFSLPFHEFSIVGDVCTVKDKHNRPQYDTVSLKYFKNFTFFRETKVEHTWEPALNQEFTGFPGI